MRLWIKELRERLGLNKPEFAKRLGIPSPAYICSWEAGKCRPREKYQLSLKSLAAESGFDRPWPEANARLKIPIITPEALRDLRGWLGLNKPQLAEKLGVTKEAVHLWERGLSGIARRHGPLLKSLAETAGIPYPNVPPAPQPKRGWTFALRKKLGLTQAEMSAKVGLSLTMISQWEKGNCAPTDESIRVLMGLAQEAGVAFDFPSFEANAQSIKELRQSLELSRAAFGARLGIAYCTVLAWERGLGRPRGRNLTRLRQLAADVRLREYKSSIFHWADNWEREQTALIRDLMQYLGVKRMWGPIKKLKVLSTANFKSLKQTLLELADKSAHSAF